MGKFFSRFKKDSVDASVSSLGNMANFYSLLIFLIAIPFVLIIALVWVTGILGFNAYIFGGFACLLAYIVWRLYRRWGIIKSKMAAQTGDFQDMMREATAERQGRGNLPDERDFYPALHRRPPPGPGHPPRRQAPAPGPGRPSQPGGRGRRTSPTPGCRRNASGRNWRNSSSSGTKVSSAPKNSTASRPACCSACPPEPRRQPLIPHRLSCRFFPERGLKLYAGRITYNLVG